MQFGIRQKTNACNFLRDLSNGFAEEVSAFGIGVLMSRRIWIIALVVALAGPSWGASEQYETAASPSEAATVLNLDAILGVSSGAKLPGVDIGIAARLGSSPVYLGADLGILDHGSDPTYVVAPLLGSLYYQLEARGPLHPLLGLMAGPVFTTGGGFDTTRLGLLVRPGINLALGNIAAINLEPRFGLIGSSFSFLPQLGATFAL